MPARTRDRCGHDGNVTAITGIESRLRRRGRQLRSRPSRGPRGSGCSRSLHAVRRIRRSGRDGASCARPRAASRQSVRPKLMGRLNGAYSGIFAQRVVDALAEPLFRLHRRKSRPSRRDCRRACRSTASTSWTRSGSDHRPRSRRHSGGGDDASGEAREDAELVRRIVSGEGYHREMLALAARYIGRGSTPRPSRLLHGLMLSHPESARDARWHDRYRSIAGFVRSAVAKYGGGIEGRRGIARMTHRMVRQRRAADAIRAAVSPRGRTARHWVGEPPSPLQARSCARRWRAAAMRDDGFSAYEDAANWREDKRQHCPCAVGRYRSMAGSGIPRRPWVAPGYALRGAVTVVVGPPSAMKSSLMLAWACAIALGGTMAISDRARRVRSSSTTSRTSAMNSGEGSRPCCASSMLNPNNIRGRVIRTGPVGVGTLLEIDSEMGIVGETLAMLGTAGAAAESTNRTC